MTTGVTEFMKIDEVRVTYSTRSGSLIANPSITILLESVWISALESAAIREQFDPPTLKSADNRTVSGLVST